MLRQIVLLKIVKKKEKTIYHLRELIAFILVTVPIRYYVGTICVWQRKSADAFQEHLLIFNSTRDGGM